MKTSLTIFSIIYFSICIIGVTTGQVINEWDWDESGADVGEFIEVFISNPQPADLSQYTIVEYETSGASAGNTQGTHALDDFTATAVVADGGTYYVLVETFEQNDAVALVGPSGVIQFLHTGNQVTANNGGAVGATSTSIGVPKGYPAGHSVQRQPNGTYTALAETPGAINNNTVNTTIEFVATSSSISENNGTIDVCVSIVNPDASNATAVDIALAGSGNTATNGTDYSMITYPVTLTFPANSSTNQCVTFTITDDIAIEGNETIDLTLQNVTGGNTAGLGTKTTHTLTIIDNDLIATFSFKALPDCDDMSGGAGIAAVDNTMYIHISDLANADGINPTSFTSSSGTVVGNILANATSGTIQITGLTDADYGTILTITANNNSTIATLEIPIVICGFSVDNGGDGTNEDDISNGVFCTPQNNIPAPSILVEAVPNTPLSSGNDIASTYVYVLVNTDNSDLIISKNNTGLFSSPDVVSGTNYSVYAFNVNDSDLTLFNITLTNLSPNAISAGDDILTKSNAFAAFCYSSCWNAAFTPACFICPTIAALTATSPICSGTATTDLTATIANFFGTENKDESYDIEFVYSTTQAANVAAVYGLTATILGTEDIAAAGVTSVTEASFILPSVTTQTTYYIYARILNATTVVPDANCRPFAEVQVVVNPIPLLSAIGTNPTTCNGTDGQINLTLTNVVDGTYTINYVDETNTAQTFTNVSITSGSATITGLSTGIFNDLSITINGCSSAQNVDVSLINPALPTATIALTMTTLCSTSAGTSLIISGDAGTHVIYSIDGINQPAIIIEADGTNEIAVNPSVTTNYALVSVSNPTTTCVQSLMDSVTLTINNIACDSTFPWAGNN